MWLETVYLFVCFGLPSPPSSLALIIRNRDVITFVKDLQQGPKRGQKIFFFLLVNVGFWTDRINNHSCATTQIRSYQRASRLCWVRTVPEAGSVIGVVTQSAPFN